MNSQVYYFFDYVVFLYTYTCKHLNPQGEVQMFIKGFYSSKIDWFLE